MILAGGEPGSIFYCPRTGPHDIRQMLVVNINNDQNTRDDCDLQGGWLQHDGSMCELEGTLRFGA